MRVITETTERTIETSTAVMAGLAAPSQGTAELSTWRVRMATGRNSPVHIIDREQVWMPLRGTFEFTVDGETAQVGAGEALAVPVAPPASSVSAARERRKPRRSSAWPRAGRRHSPAAMPGSRCHGRCERLRDEGADGFHAVRVRRDGASGLTGPRRPSGGRRLRRRCCRTRSWLRAGRRSGRGLPGPPRCRARLTVRRRGQRG